MTRRVIAFLIVGHACFAATSIVAISPTQTEATIVVSAGQAGCVIHASTGIALGADIPDIVDNGTTEARVGTTGHSPGTVTFHLGKHTGDDALEQGATYTVGMTCGGDSQVVQTFTTHIAPWGNQAPVPIPFDSTKFGNAAWPQFVWGGSGHSAKAITGDSHVDPMTGFRASLAGPEAGWSGGGDGSFAFNNTSNSPIDINATGKWSPIANAVVNHVSTPSSFAVVSASAGAGDPIFIPLAPFININGNGGAGGWLPGRSVLDDILITAFCKSASTSDVNFTYQLATWSSGSISLIGSTQTMSGTCPTSSTVSSFQTAAHPSTTPWSNWGLTNYPALPMDVLSPTGSSTGVTCNGASPSVCTLAVTVSSTYFPIEYPLQAPILINGAYEHVASVQSSTAFTLVENGVSVTSAAWAQAAFGIVVTHNGTGSASVAFGLDPVGDGDAAWDQNGDFGDTNLMPVQAGQNSDGTGALVNGYIRILDNGGGSLGALVLHVPYNADGSYRNETRLLSLGQIPSSAYATQLVANGDTIGGPHLAMSFNIRQAKNGIGPGSIVYSLDASGARFWQIAYTPSLHSGACANYPAYANPYGADGNYNLGGTQISNSDCFIYTNLTPTSASPPMDFYSQLVRGYKTGLNQKGQVVGNAHPNFDMTWLGTTAGASIAGGGYVLAGVAACQNCPKIIGGFTLAPDVSCNCSMLVFVRDSWGGDGDVEGRWCGDHTEAATTDQYSMISCDTINNGTTTNVLTGPFEMIINQINTAGYGSTPVWSGAGSSALSSATLVTCPSVGNLPSRYNALAGTANCVQVEVTSPPGSAFPNTSHTFPDGKTEAAEYPLITPGFGNANVAKSKLMDILSGDWMYANDTGDAGEHFVALNIVWNNTTSGYIWLLRQANQSYTQNQTNFNLGGPFAQNHSTGWHLRMAPTISVNGGGSGGALQMNFLSNGTGANSVLIDNPEKTGCHVVAGAGFEQGNYVWLNSCQTTPNGSPAYATSPSLSASKAIFTAMFPLTTSFPGFAGSAKGPAAGSAVQSYPFGYHNFLSGIQFPVLADMRALNPASGFFNADQPAAIGAAATITLVGGTSHSYLITDTLSTGTDYKRLALYGYHGTYIFKDISSPTTGNTTDMANETMCYANAANECFQGSSIGNRYISSTSVNISTTTPISNSFSSSVPAITQLQAIHGRAIMINGNISDPTGQISIKPVTYNFTTPGSQYVFDNARLSPNSDFLFGMCFWCNGKRTEWISVRVGNNFTYDLANRSTFIPVIVKATAPQGADHAQARFGYLDNEQGSGHFFRCKLRQEDCTTRFPGTDPFGFVGEAGLSAGTSVTPGAQASITIPALPNTILYYVIDWLQSGTTIGSTPIAQVAVP